MVSYMSFRCFRGFSKHQEDNGYNFYQRNGLLLKGFSSIFFILMIINTICKFSVKFLTQNSKHIDFIKEKCL